MHEYGISGAFMAQGMDTVEIKEKMFQYSCKVDEFKQIFDYNPDEASRYAKKRLTSEYSLASAQAFTNSFRMIHDLVKYCHSSYIKNEELKKRLQILYSNYEKVPDIAGERILPLINNGIRELDVLVDRGKLAPRFIRLCDELVELLHMEVMVSEPQALLDKTLAVSRYQAVREEEERKKQEEERLRREEDERLQKEKEEQERQVWEEAERKKREEEERKQREEGEKLQREKEERQRIAREEDRLRKQKEDEEKSKKQREEQERRRREEDEKLRRQREEEKERPAGSISKFYALALVLGALLVGFWLLALGSDKITTNSIGMEFVLIPAGEFEMGSPSGESGRYSVEGPIHKVTIEEAYYLGKYEVTQEQWRAVMGSNPSNFKGDDLPVEKVSWDDVQEFVRKLNEMEGTDKYRLPSEAEWEYAGRAGTTTRYSFGDDESDLSDYAWYNSNSGSKTHPVGQKQPNLWGLYDVHGNVLEWVQDKHHSNYDGAPTDGSVWENEDGYSWAGRGGSWNFDAGLCRSAARFSIVPGGCESALGFRLLQEL